MCAREFAEATEKPNEQAVQTARDLEQAAVCAKNIAKVRADAESQALKAAEDKIHAEAIVAVAFRKQIAEAKQARDATMSLLSPANRFTLP